MPLAVPQAAKLNNITKAVSKVKIFVVFMVFTPFLFQFLFQFFVLLFPLFSGTIIFFSFAKAVAKADRLDRTGTDTLTAAYAFGMVGSFGYIYIHLAYFGTLSAGNAFVFVYFHSEKRHLVKQCIKCTERTQPLAERSVEKYTQYDYRNQYAKLPRKERTQCGTDSRINGGKRDCPPRVLLEDKDTYRKKDLPYPHRL